MGSNFWRGKFGPMLTGTAEIPFNDISALRKQLSTRQFAAFIVEALQSEAGIHLPDRDYLAEARELRQYRTLFVAR